MEARMGGRSNQNIDVTLHNDELELDQSIAHTLLGPTS